MNELSQVIETPPFSMTSEEKNVFFLDYLTRLTAHHRKNCVDYSKILDAMGTPTSFDTINDIPFIPVRLFKELQLKSIPDESVFKVLKSSGTSGQTPSSIYIDKEVADNQRKVLAKLTAQFIGPSRLPMLVIDSKTTLKDPKSFSARGAGILGFSLFGKNITYALDDEMKLDIETITAFLERHEGSNILLFGFTSIVWEYFVAELKKQKITLDLSAATLIHGGGWKKLVDQGITNDMLKADLATVANVRQVYNYYGMIEQTGSVFFECEHGKLHTSNFSDIIIRGDDLKPLANNQKGLIQLLSLIPTSYPGHSILSEDWGEILGEDDCKCQRKGKYFRILGA